MAAGDFDHVLEHASPMALAPAVRVDADIQHVGLVGRHRHDAVTDHRIGLGQRPAAVTDAQAVDEDAQRPGVLIGTLFNRNDLRQIVFTHRPQARGQSLRLRLHSSSAWIRRANSRSCHARRFSAGLRSR